MTVSKRNSLFAVNVIVPLVCGLFIFLTKTENIYLSDSLRGVRSVLPVIISIAVVLTGLIVVFALNCYYYDDSMSVVVITGTAFFDFAGDYKGMYFDGDFSGSRELPYREASVPVTVSEECGEGFEEDWGDGGEEDWDPELWDEIENGGGGDDWED